MRTVLSVLTLGLVLGSTSVTAQSRSATVTGVVVDSAGRPIRGAVIRLTSGGTPAADSLWEMLGRTDNAGAFSLSDVTPGPIMLGVHLAGYRSLTAAASVAPAVSVALRVTLQALDSMERMTPADSAILAVADAADRAASDANRRFRDLRTVRGIVFDSLGDVVANADISLLGTDLTARTDTAGGFEIPGASPGAYVVRARRLGFTPAFGKVAINDSAPSARLELWMKPMGQRLAKVTVRATRWSTAALAEFERRRRLYTGVFIRQEELERAAGGRVSSLFYGRNGFTVVGSGANAGSILGRKGCQSEVILNGIMIREATVDALVSPSDVIAIEAYNSAINVPVDLLGRGVREGTCGIIAVWTR